MPWLRTPSQFTESLTSRPICSNSSLCSLYQRQAIHCISSHWWCRGIVRSKQQICSSETLLVAMWTELFWKLEIPVKKNGIIVKMHTQGPQGFGTSGLLSVGCAEKHRSLPKQWLARGKECVSLGMQVNHLWLLHVAGRNLSGRNLLARNWSVAITNSPCFLQVTLLILIHDALLSPTDIYMATIPRDGADIWPATTSVC